MSKVFSAHAVSVDGYISGRTPDGEEFGRGLGDAPMLFDWYTDGDTPSQVFGGFRLSEPSARFFDAIAARVGAAVAGRTTYEHSEPVVVRGRVIEWLEGDAAWEIIDQLSRKYTGAPYPRGQERVVVMIEPERQTVGVG